MAYRINGKFVSKKDYEAWQNNQIPSQPSSKTKGKHHFVYLLDESYSMFGFRSRVIPALKSFMDQHINGVKLNKDTVVSVYTFNGEIYSKKLNKHIQELVVLPNDKNINTFIDRINFNPGSSTPLYWAILESLKSINMTKDDTLALYVITDGEENTSQITSNVIKDAITSHTKDGRYSFIVSCPTPQAKSIFLGLGVPENNLLVWEQTTKGFEDMTYSNARASTAVRTSYSMGHTQSFNAFVDMQNVTPTQLKKDLIDITKQYRALQVEKECDIKAFFEEKTGRPYNPGVAFYQLTKKELIQGTKQVLIFDKLTNKLYGGAEARELIGLSSYADTRVTPLNFMTYEIYVQSTSVNRKLVRGTKLYYKF